MTDPLAPLKAYRQWIIYRLEAQADTTKLAKRPLDWRTGQVASAQDPANWLSYDEAVSTGHPVGFVFTNADPFWFVDIDQCRQGDVWSPLATELCGLLAGAAIEVSVSGQGLHIFGTGAVPAHSSRNDALHLEFYTEGRFAAIGTGAIGDAGHDCTAGVATLVGKYFEPRAEVTPASWSTAPVPEWRGPLDDDDLIQRMTRAKPSGAAAFGTKATVIDLWDAKEASLGAAYPDTGGRAYNCSSADAALAQHLAFWTGKDCARIERLMRRSKLARAKWDTKGYLSGTILNAVEMQVDVLADKPPEPPSNTLAQTEMRDVTGETWLTPDDQKIMFHGCVYVASAHAIMMTDGQLYNEGRFNALCGGFSYVLERNTSKLAKSAWHSFIDNRDVRFPKVKQTEFAPERTAGERWGQGNTTFVNSYVPINVKRTEGNPAPFLEHLAKLLPVAHDRDILLAYMAAVVQHPGIKFKWAPLLQGCEGNGKTLVSRCVVEAIGRAYCHTPKASQIASRFNDWIDGKIFIAVEDVFPQQDDSLMEALTPMLTNEWQEVEAKGGAKVSRRICANFILNANRKDALRKTRNGRRFAMFYTAQQSLDDLKKCGMDSDYFFNLFNWLNRDGWAIVANYLHTYAIPAALNPATHCERAPVTSSTEEAITASVGRLEQEIQEAIEQDQVGFRDGWISSHFLDKLIKDLKFEARYPRNTRGALLLDLGYIPHPGLVGGQVNNTVSPDGAKPRLFIKSGHERSEAKGAEVSRLYMNSQTVMPPEAVQLRVVV